MANTPTRVLVVDDHELVRRGLGELAERVRHRDAQEAPGDAVPS